MLESALFIKADDGVSEADGEAAALSELPGSLAVGVGVVERVALLPPVDCAEVVLTLELLVVVASASETVDEVVVASGVLDSEGDSVSDATESVVDARETIISTPYA